MKLTYSALTYQPEDKDVNQDSYYADLSEGLFIVSDGIGGCKHSEVASRLIVTAIPDALSAHGSGEKTNVKECLQKAVRAAASQLHEAGKKDIALHNISATLTLLFIQSEKYWIVQVGDSLAYLFRNSTLRQMTEDHSIAFQQYMAGAIKKADIQSHPNQKMLTRCFSATRDFVLSDIFEGELQGNDIFLLCSDGLTKEVSDTAITEILNLSSDISGTAQQLLEKVKVRNGKDDTTILLIRADKA